MTHFSDSTLELSDEELHLYSRQILLEAWDIEAQEQLKYANVLIVGAGGIGCTSAELLARAGVGKLTLIDPDTIETSNLQRQTAFLPKHVGLYKAQTLAMRLQYINPNIQIEFYNDSLNAQNAKAYISHQDLVLDGCDNFETRYLVNRTCKNHAVPLLSASAIGLQAQLFMVNQDSACYECLFPQDQDTVQNHPQRCADTGVLATTPVVIASLQAHHALLFLGLNQSPLLQKLLIWDGLNMKQRILSFEKDINCPICQAKLSLNTTKFVKLTK